MDQYIYSEKRKSFNNDEEIFYWKDHHSLNFWMYEVKTLGLKDNYSEFKPSLKIYLKKENIDDLFFLLITNRGIYSSNIIPSENPDNLHMDLSFVKIAYERLNAGERIYYIADW